MPQNAFFLQTRDLLVSKKTMQRHFFPTLHPLSTVNFATATVLAFVLLRDSRFNFHRYTQCEATPTQKSALEWCCDLSCLLAWKITKGIHSCKPASLNCPIVTQRLIGKEGNSKEKKKHVVKMSLKGADSQSHSNFCWKTTGYRK